MCEINGNQHPIGKVAEYLSIPPHAPTSAPPIVLSFLLDPEKRVFLCSHVAVCERTMNTPFANKLYSGTDKVEHPYVCCWGNIPTKLISAVFRHEDMIGGSLNRWLPFYIQPKVKTERYPHAESDYNAWVNTLFAARATLDSRTFTFTKEADDTRFEWFEKLRSDAIKSGEQIGESRFHTHAVKFTGIFALAENPPTKNDVEKHHWETALRVVRYLTATY